MAVNDITFYVVSTTQTSVTLYYEHTNTRTFATKVFVSGTNLNFNTSAVLTNQTVSGTLTATGLSPGTTYTYTATLRRNSDNSFILSRFIYPTTVALTTYTVSYNSNGGSNSPPSETVQENNTVTLPSPGSRSGFTFNYWISSYNGGAYSAGSSSHPIVSNTTFTASWTQLTWTVFFNGNGGSTPSSQTVAQGSAISLPSSSRSGFTFTGWWTSSSGGSFIGSAGSSYTPSNNITLFAQWQALAPGFTDEIVTGIVPININVNTLADNRVVATNADQYSLISAGGTFPSWLSINNSGFLSGSTGAVGTYTFRVRATNSTSGQSVDSNIITITVIYPGDRATSSSTTTNINSAKRWDGSAWVDLTIMRRWNGSSWINISN
jgi:uncharacterized repeat protein (TIGR02543 family)